MSVGLDPSREVGYCVPAIPRANQADQRVGAPRLPFPDDVFRHVPGLKGRIKPPNESRMRLSYARFDELDALAVAEKRPPGWRMSHEDREANRRQIMDGRLDRDLWVFAYGSLIWDPAVHVSEFRLATLGGWRRRFCLSITGSRGTPDRPGLMAALDEGGLCEGVVFRIHGDIVDRETELLWMREMFAGAYRPKFVRLSTPQGDVEALTFVVDPNNERYCPDLPMTEAAEIIAHAEGYNGANFEYLDQLCAQLTTLGLSDAEMAELHRLAARVRRQSNRTD